MPTTVLIDFSNLCRRCHSVAGFGSDEDAFLFKYLRSLRSIVERHQPSSVVLVKEGSPKHRYEILPTYKGQRKLKEDDPEFQAKWKGFMTLKERMDAAVDFSLKSLEVTVVRHPELEADDVIASLARYLVSEREDVVVVSTDRDFEQLLGDGTSIRVWEPKKKEWMSTVPIRRVVNEQVVGEARMTTEQIVARRALIGDKSDNVPGVPGFGPKRATALIERLGDSLELMSTQLSDEQLATYERNRSLFRFRPMDRSDWFDCQIMAGHWDPSALMIDLHMHGMASLVSGPPFDRLCDVFSGLKRAKLPVGRR